MIKLRIRASGGCYFINNGLYSYMLTIIINHQRPANRSAIAFRLILSLLFISILPLSAQFSKAQIDSVNNLSSDYIFSNIRASVKLFTKAVHSADEMNYEAGQARSLQNLALAMYLNGKYEESVAAHLKALDLLEKLNRPDEVAATLGELGYQMKRRDLPKAMEYMRAGMRIAETEDYRDKLSTLYDNYGVLHEMGGNRDSASYYYQKALTLKTARNDTIGIPFSLNKLVGIHLMRNEFSEAASLLHLSDWYRNRQKGNYGRSENTVFWGDLYLQQGRLDSAGHYYQKYITLPGTSEHNYQAAYCFERLAEIYERKQDYYQAWRNQKLFKVFNDSLVNIQTNQRIAELQIEYEAEKKDRQIAENLLKLKLSNTRNYILTGVVLTLLILIFVIYKYQALKRDRIRQELELTNRIKQAEFEQSIAQEKLRISRELHDNIGSQLTFMISSMDNLSYLKSPAEVQQRVSDLGVFGRTTLAELRNTVWAMRHEEGSLDALILKLNELRLQIINHVRQLEVEIQNQVTRPLSLSSMQLLNLYRIFQEAFQNTLKHTAASRITLLIAEVEDRLMMKYTDNGNGFDKSLIQPGSGLSIMEQRCTESGGKFTIGSSPAGTEIAIEISLN